MRTNKSNFSKHAFTIVELAMAIVLIGILSVILVMGSGQVFTRARDSRRSVNTNSILSTD